MDVYPNYLNLIAPRHILVIHVFFFKLLSEILIHSTIKTNKNTNVNEHNNLFKASAYNKRDTKKLKYITISRKENDMISTFLRRC